VRINLHVHNYRYVFMVLIAYAWSMMPIIFLLSFAFKEASAAYVWITVANILSGMSKKVRLKVKAVYSASWETHLRATWRHLPYMGSHGVTCHPTQVNAPRLNPSLADRLILDLATPELT